MAPTNMNRIGYIALLVAVVSIAFMPVAAASSGGLLGQLQCPCDCGKYLSVCDCSDADNGRAYVNNLQEQGFADAEVAQAYGEKFGERFVQFVPKEGSGLSLWLTPFAGVVVGAGGIFLYFKKFRETDGASAAAICPDCGSGLEDGAEYCPSCGSHVDDAW